MLCFISHVNFGISIFFLDVDECSNIPNLCVMGKCINTYGSYKCECNKGFSLRADTKKCEGIPIFTPTGLSIIVLAMAAFIIASKYMALAREQHME